MHICHILLLYFILSFLSLDQKTSNEVTTREDISEKSREKRDSTGAPPTKGGDAESVSQNAEGKERSGPVWRHETSRRRERDTVRSCSGEGTRTVDWATG